MNIYIANIPFRANEDEVRELFTRYGDVASVRIVLDKETQKSRGFGFVIMNNDGEASDAIQGLNGFNLFGKALSVSEAKPKEPRQDGPKRSFSNNDSRPYTPRDQGDRPNRPYTPRTDGDRPNRPFTPRTEGGGNGRPYTPRPNGDRPYTPRTGGNEFQAAPPVFPNDNVKSKREKEFKKDKPERTGFDADKKLKKETKNTTKYNRFDDDDDEMDYKIGKY